MTIMNIRGDETITSRKRFCLIACEILFREACMCAATCRNVIDITFMSKKLHDLGEAKMSAALQKQIDSTDARKYDAILLCYGLCNYGVRSLHSEIPLVIPRAHDCVTLLMGSKELYMDYYYKNPGTLFHSAGWIERDSETSAEEGGIMAQLGIDKSYEEFRELYGDEDAEYLEEMLSGWQKNYKKVAFINAGTGDYITDSEFSKAYANEHEWEYEEITGNLSLLSRMFNGEWDDSSFLVVSPGHSIEPSYSEDILRCAETDLTAQGTNEGRIASIRISQ